VDFTVIDPHSTTVRVEKKLHYESEGDASEAAEMDMTDGGAVTASNG